MLDPVNVDRQITGWCSHIEAKALNDLAEGQVVLELGSLYGKSTVYMAEKAVKVHAVDTHEGDETTRPLLVHGHTLTRFVDNLKYFGLYDKVVIHVGLIEEVLPFLKPASFDMVFVDAYHTYEAVKGHIRLARPLMKEKCIWAFHDYANLSFGGVKQAVDEEFHAPFEVIDSIAIIRS